MKNCRYLIGYWIFVNVASTVDFGLFPEYDSTPRLCHIILHGDTLDMWHE